MSEPSERGSSAPERWLRSYGRRKGRKLSPHQSDVLLRGLANCAIDMTQELFAPCPGSLFQEPVREVWLEIGFGAGEHFIWQAQHNPYAGLIGAEPYLNGVVAALSQIGSLNLGGRTRIHADDVLSLLNWLPEASLSRGFVLFPDPWPKKRHRERRIFSPRLLDKLSRLLRSGGELRFASDIADYAEEAIGHATAHQDFEIVQIFTSQNRDAVSDWPATRYEQKAAKQGRSSTFISLRRT